ncbi:hypothetical protein SFRURICE_006216, partial [Spodoptera frugiperda]
MYSLRTNILILANAVDASEKRRREARKRRLARRLMRIDMTPSLMFLRRNLVPFIIVSQITVSRSIKEVTEALNKIYHKYVKWPTQSDERNIIKAKFYQKFGFPGILGCIDGTHVAILRPHIHEERYYNRKGFHSLNVMIICDSDLNILCVDASTPGSAHDSTVWQSHPLSLHLKQITENTNEQWLSTKKNHDDPNPQYYRRDTTTSLLCETCDCTQYSGALHRGIKSTFQHVHYIIAITAGKIVNACCVLHNIANTAREPLPSDEVYEESTDTAFKIWAHSIQYRLIRLRPSLVRLQWPSARS